MGAMKDLWFFARELESLNDHGFEEMIFESIGVNPRFSNVIKSNPILDHGYDIKATEKINETKTRQAIFVIKRYSIISPDLIRNICDYWSERKLSENSKLYLISEGTSTPEAKTVAQKYDIDIWDLYHLYSIVDEEIKSKYSQFSFKSITTKSTEEDFSAALVQIRPGKLEWSAYQQLCSKIISHLFSPPLGSPRYESPDAEGRNRRDMIFENSNDHPFWKMIREIYHGHYIIFDSKNSQNPIDKLPVIEIAHYLKPYGCGMFAVLLTRKGSDDAANHAIKEQWIGNGKLIMVINDTDMREMLKIKQANGKPEEIIRMKIADFRMSL